MKFNEPVSWYSLSKKLSKETLEVTGTKNPKDFYRKFVYEALTDKSTKWQGLFSASNLMAERQWYQCGKPYYKIWPGIFDPFVSTRMDISTDYLRSPHKAFMILFPDIEEQLLTFKMGSGEWYVSSILVEDFSPLEVLKQTKMGFIESLDKIFPNSKYKDKERGVIKIRIDFKSRSGYAKYVEDIPPEAKGLLDGVDVPSVFFRNIEVVPGVTIEQAIGEFVDITAEDIGEYEEVVDISKEVVPAEIIKACFRLIVGIYFVSTGSQKVLERDVLTKHLAAYQEMRAKGDEEKCKEYESKARQKGKYGWNVGIDRKGRNLVLPKGITYEDAIKQAGGSHHLYQHERGAHWHLYWTGAGRAKPVVKWVEETMVRPDLPVKPMV